MALENVLQEALQKIAPKDVLAAAEAIREKDKKVEGLIREIALREAGVLEIKHQLQEERQAEIKRSRIGFTIIIAEFFIIIILALKILL